MGSDQFIIVISNFCVYMLPVLGVVALIFLILFLKHLLVVVKSMDKTLNEATKTIQDCDVQVKKLDKPLHTVGELSETVDYVHESSKKAVASTVSLVVNNLGNIADWVKEKKSKDFNEKAESEVVESE